MCQKPIVPSSEKTSTVLHPYDLTKVLKILSYHRPRDPTKFVNDEDMCN